MPLVYLERLARCPGTEDRQGTADLAALETPEGVASLPSPLHFWAEETERSARWRPLCPRTLAGLADWSPEGTEERRAPCNAVYTALSPEGPALKALDHWHQGVLAEDYRSADPSSARACHSDSDSGEYEKWHSPNKELEHNWGCSAQQPKLTTSTSLEEER